jgi:hypothetical protein
MGTNEEYGCCPAGKICYGEGGSVWVDEKVNYQGGGNGGTGTGTGGEGGTGSGEGGASPFGDDVGTGGGGRVVGGKWGYGMVFAVAALGMGVVL